MIKKTGTWIPASMVIACLLATWALSGNAQVPVRTELIRSPTGQSPSSANDGQVVVNTDLISFNITVTDSKGRFVSGISKDAFTVYDNKLPQRIVFFGDEDLPVSVGIIFDVSESMGGNKLKQARGAVARFIETSDKRDEFFLIAFNSRPQLLIERTHDADAVMSALAKVRPQGETALLDAVYLAAEKIQHSQHQRRALLLISDGRENSSRFKLKEVQRMLQESGANLYSIGIVEGISLPSKPGFSIQVFLGKLSDPTGGKTYFPQSSAALDRVFETIALELRHQYSIGYRPDAFIPDGKWHHVKVKVSRPGADSHLSIRSRKGYFAFPRQP